MIQFGLRVAFANNRGSQAKITGKRELVDLEGFNSCSEASVSEATYFTGKTSSNHANTNGRSS